MLEEVLWVEKYRPRTIEDTILPERLKKPFQKYADGENLPNLMLAGRSGIGKTTVARAMADQLGADFMIINGSLNGNIDTLRNDIQRFASSVSFNGGRKIVCLDEADNLTDATQKALRNFTEEYSKNTAFILTCNFKNRLIEPLHSRCKVIDFTVGKADMADLATQFMKRVMWILEAENVEYDKAAVAAVIKKFYPDWRRVLNELQDYAATGKIDSGILANLSETSIKALMGFLKNKEFTNARKWVGENIDTDSAALFRTLYDTATQYVDKASVPALVLIIGKYQYQDAFVADKEINVMACLTEIMVDCEWL